MVEQIVAKECSIQFDPAALARWHIPATILQANYLSLPQEGGAATSENGRDRDTDPRDPEDVVQAISDQLWKAPWWWILEIFPFPYSYQDLKKHWTTSWW